MYWARTGPPTLALPPLRTAIIGERLTPVIDSTELLRFAQLHRLPQLPDLNQCAFEAARDIHRALRRIADRPRAALAWGQLGMVLQSHQHLSPALVCYQRAGSLAPNSYEWAYYVGRIHAERYEYAPAVESYQLAADLNPNYAPTFLALGNLALQQADLASAQKAFQRLVTLRPQATHGYLGLARIAFDSRNYQQTVDLLEDAVSVDPADFRVHHLLGQACQQLGQTERARYHLAIVNNLNSRDERSKHVVFEDPLYYRMLASNTTDRALSERMQTAMGTGQFQLAIQLGMELCEKHPDDALRWHKLAQACKRAKRYSDALEHVEAAIRLDSDLSEAQLTKAQLLVIVDRTQEALKLLNAFVAKEPNSFDGHYNRGAVQLLCGELELAITSFREAVRRREHSARAHVALAEALGQAGKWSEARTEYRRALELDPLNARARQRLENVSKARSAAADRKQ